MALERVGLGAVVTVDTKPMVKGLGQGRDAMGRFVGQANKVPPPLNRIGQAAMRLAAQMKTMGTRFMAGAAMVGQGMMKMGMGLLPMAMAFGSAVKSAISFEKQMDAVSAVARSTAEEQALLEKKAKQMGITSAFSATQSGEAMEYMARSGAKTAQIITGLDGVMNAAAADGIELGAAADIVAQSIKGMGMSWDDAGRVADVLALASSSVNTNMTGLSESLKMAMPAAKSLNLTYEETVAILGKIADAGVKGTMAGTSFNNMMVKLSKPTGRAAAKMKEWGISLTEVVDGVKKVRPMGAIIKEFSAGLQSVEDPFERLGIAAEITGLRGQKALNALVLAGEGLDGFKNELDNAAGSAKIMAEKRLDNLAGKLTLLKSSLEGLAIGVFGPQLKGISDAVGGFTDSLNKVLFALEDINEVWNDVTKNPKAADKLYEKHGSTVMNVALGIRDAVQMAIDGWTWLTKKIKAAGAAIKESVGEDGLRTLTKVITVIAGIAGVLAPVMLAGMMLKWVFGGLITVLMGVGKMVIAAFWPMLILAAAALLAWQLLKNENESFGDTAVRVWGNIYAGALDVWENVLKPMWQGIKEGFTPAIEELGKVWEGILVNVKMVFAELFEFMFGELEGAEISWREVGQVIGAAFGAMAKAILVFVKYVIPAIASVAKAVYKVVSTVWGWIEAIITDVAEAVAKVVFSIEQMFSGNVLNGVARFGAAILDFVLKPLQLIVKAAVKIAEAVGKDVPAKLKDFAKDGMTGVLFGTSGEGSGRKEYKTKAEMNAAAMGIKLKKPRHKFAKIKPMDRKKAAEEAAKADKDEKGKKKGGIPDIAAVMKGIGAKTPKVETEVNLEDKRTLEIQNEMCIDGEGVNIASSRHKQELQERAGFKATPWQKRAMLEHGAAPMNKAS